MAKKKYIFICCTVFVCAATILLDKFHWNAVAYLSARYNSLISGIFYDFIFALRFIMICTILILNVCGIVKLHAEYSRDGICLWLSLAIIICTIFAQYILPLTKIGIYLDYRLNLNRREEIVEMAYNGELAHYQSNTDEYFIPNRLFGGVSYNAKILFSGEPEHMKILFYVHKGFFADTAVIYVSDEEAAKNGDFGFVFEEVEKIDEHWYSIRKRAG